MTLAIPSTPASYFHLLRWQVFSRIRRPLIVFTPKSLLRSKAATSPVTDFTSGHFRAVIGDTTADPAAVRKVLLCSGKIYYDLIAERTKLGTTDTAIVRIERPTRFRCGPSRGDRPVPERGTALGAGRAGEPGRVAVRLDELPAGGGAHDRGHHATIVVLTGRRLAQPSRTGAARPDRRGLRLTVRTDGQRVAILRGTHQATTRGAALTSNNEAQHADSDSPRCRRGHCHHHSSGRSRPIRMVGAAGGQRRQRDRQRTVGP